MPPQVCAALEYLRFAEQLRNPPSGFDGMRVEGRDLQPAEERVYVAGLKVLEDYFKARFEYQTSSKVVGDGPEDRPSVPSTV